MFSLTIVFGPGPMVWTLMFKSKEAAEEVTLGIRNALKTRGTDVSFSPTNVIAVGDDFGQHADITASSIHGVMFEDLEQSKLAHIERALHQARVKVKADEMAMADPVIKSGAMRQQSPILQPAMPGMPQPNGRWS